MKNEEYIMYENEIIYFKNKDDKNLGEFKLPCYCNLCSKMCDMNYFNLIVKKGKAKSINEFNQISFVIVDQITQ